MEIRDSGGIGDSIDLSLISMPSGVQWPFISIWNTVLPPTGKEISGAGTMFQITLMLADPITPSKIAYF
jgi:hypothetical protein